jgi:two-component SAPR family response regulator
MCKVSALLVEDEGLIMMMLADMVHDLGHLIASEATNIKTAMSLAETGPFDLALLDINIAGALVTPVVDILDRRGVPIVFVSGYSDRTMPAELKGRLLVEKPFSKESLLDAINRATGQATAARASI